MREERESGQKIIEVGDYGVLGNMINFCIVVLGIRNMTYFVGLRLLALTVKIVMQQITMYVA